MAAHGICFDSYYCPKPRQIGQNGRPPFVDTPLAGLNYQNQIAAQYTN